MGFTILAKQKKMGVIEANCKLLQITLLNKGVTKLFMYICLYRKLSSDMLIKDEFFCII